METNMYIGAAYYPELWEENEIEKDIERCKRIGVNCLRVGEFAWGKMEPREGVFEFDWLYSIVDRLHAEGIKTVMCTPTCTPPRWFLNKYPETREVSSDGVRRDVSSRCHPCKTSLLMRRKNREIVTEMAKVFGKHPGVIGWQIDNELFVYNNGCYCELCKNAFRTYLKTK
jgi:beta-galactosidase GanA